MSHDFGRTSRRRIESQSSVRRWPVQDIAERNALILTFARSPVDLTALVSLGARYLAYNTLVVDLGRSIRSPFGEEDVARSALGWISNNRTEQWVGPHGNAHRQPERPLRIAILWPNSSRRGYSCIIHQQDVTKLEGADGPTEQNIAAPVVVDLGARLPRPPPQRVAASSGRGFSCRSHRVRSFRGLPPSATAPTKL